MKMRITEAQLRRLIREDLQGFLDKTANIKYKGHIQDPTFDADWQQDLPNKQQARRVKQIWATEADHDFMNAVVKVHWIKNRGVENLKGDLDRFLSMTGKNEISTMGYPPSTTSFSTNWGPIGVVVQGHTTIAANRMSSLFSGFTGNITPELADKYKHSGIPKRPTSFLGASDPSSLADDFILDKKSFNPRLVGGNEFIVANWRPVGIVLALDVRDALFKQALGEETKFMTRADAEAIVSVVESSGLPIYSDWDEDEINMWRDRVRGQQSAEASQPDQTVTEARIRRIVRETLLRESPAGPVMYTGVVLPPEEVARMEEKIYTLGLYDQIPDWVTSLVSTVHGHQVLNHHMTIAPGALSLDNPLRDLLGEPMTLLVTGWGVDHKLGVAAWRVEPDPSLATKSGNPHITAALGGPTVKPFAASKIREWMPLEETFTVTGVLREIHTVVTPIAV